MLMRILKAALFAVGSVVFLLMFHSKQFNGQPGPPPDIEAVKSVTLVFGAKDAAPQKWDGSVQIPSGRLVRITGYHFTEACRIVGGNGWTCSSHEWDPRGGAHPSERPGPYPSLVQPVGVTIEFTAPEEAEIEVDIRRKFKFRWKDVPETGAIYPSGGNVEIYRTPPVEQLTGGESENDYPSLAMDSKDRLWCAWQGYKSGAEQVFLRRYEAGRWSGTWTVTEKPGDLFMTAVAAVQDKAVVVFSEHEQGAWRLKARIFDGTRFNGVEVVAGAGNNLFHRVASDRQGRVHVVYQSWRGGRSNIYLRTRTTRWSEEILLSDPARPQRVNDWAPAVATARDGTVWVAWDGYARGSYNVYLRMVRDGKAGPIIAVTDSARFHANPTLAVDAEDRVWIAWDEAPEHWGKNQGFLLHGGVGLYNSRTVRVAVYGGGRWLTTLQQPDANLPFALTRLFHTPRLVMDSAGRIWLFTRPRSSVSRVASYLGVYGKWEVFAQRYENGRWTEPIPIPGTQAGDETEFAVAADSKGSVFAAMVGDHRQWGARMDPINRDLFFTRLRTDRQSSQPLAPRSPEPPTTPSPEPREAAQVAGVRGYSAIAGLKIFRGDLHRHTEISSDGAGDGSLWDAYRYAMDAASLDYLAVTDHQSGGQEYSWWRIQKSADMFNVPGFFTALYGTERSVGAPNGHRNLFFAHRGVPILPITERDNGYSGPILYPFVRKWDGVSSPHTTASSGYNDWTDNDPQLEPIVEIYQGARFSAEHDGAPLAPSQGVSPVYGEGFRPEGVVWNAWAKGYKLGVQSSSDHVSTHISYACIVARDSSREELLNAMRKRHTYGATTNMILDFHAGPSHLQGDIFESGQLPELIAKITGSAALRQVVLIRDNRYIYTKEPDGESFTLRYRENSLSPGEHYYYVRAEQADGNVGWSSPIWVKFTGAKKP